MRYVFWFWFVPLALLWSWFGLSYHDINLGLSFFSRETHDLVFAIYGHILGLEKQVIVGLLIKACIVDTALIMAILAFRRRKAIRAWWVARREAAKTPVDQVSSPAE